MYWTWKKRVLKLLVWYLTGGKKNCRRQWTAWADRKIVPQSHLEFTADDSSRPAAHCIPRRLDNLFLHLLFSSDEFLSEPRLAVSIALDERWLTFCSQGLSGLVSARLFHGGDYVVKYSNGSFLATMDEQKSAVVVHTSYVLCWFDCKEFHFGRETGE